jgi:hypothetical protein
MNRMVKYIPSMCSGVEYEEYEFNSFEEFMQTPIIEHNKNWFGDTFVGVFFKKFVVRPYSNKFIVQCYYTENKEEKNCVIGFLDNSNYVEELLEEALY